MKMRILTEVQGQRSFVLVFDTDEEVVGTLQEWARRERIKTASFTGIGAFRTVTLGYFDLQQRDYHRIPVDAQVELLSLIGNVALAQGQPRVHAHVVVGCRDGTTRGGHLLEALVRPTLELVVTEAPTPLHRTTDEETGLPLLNPDARV